MSKQKRENRNTNLVALTGGAALLAIAVNFAINALKKNRKKKDLPGSTVQVNLSPPEILRLANRIIAKSKEVHDSVASVPLDKVTYTTAILPLAELEAQQFPLVQSCVFPKLVSTSEDVRKASAEAERRIDAHVSSCSKREDVYRVIKAVAARGEWMNTEAKRYTQCLVRDFEHSGLSLTLTKREELQRLSAQIDELSRRYIRNLNDDSTSLLVSETELVGLPPEFLESLDKAENGKFKVTLRSHHVSPILEFCKVGLTRRIVAVAYGRRCEVNLSILESLVQLRHKSARLLGYSNYADYAVNHRMANSSSKVFEFLEELSASLTDLATRELSMLKDLKKKEEGDFPFGIEDLLYYVKRVEEQQFNLDLGALKQYFPFNLVMSGILKICQDLFGLRFEEIEDAEVWHSDVHLYSVYDLSSSELLGYFYLDMFSREGKYGHTCVVALQNGSFVDGARKIPVALLTSQLQKEVGHTGLLRFSEVVNLFHEFGHVVHHICNRASFARFSGLRLDPDFVEIPAQVLENWCYESISLKLVSGFYQDITKPIKDETCKALKRWRCSFSALKLKQEILYCLFDQIIHSTENVDMVGLFKHLHPKVMLGLPMLEGTNPASCFPRTAIGYEAACYSRIWSEVFAADIFASKFRDDLSNQFAGMQFRNKVLAPGGAKDPVEILMDFLGREPSIQAFIDSKTESGL
ncbi:putative thimet oligopeptidase [Camellia lanceoleosa]|uniref:Thimet oligopeptidase n=1 Tax=Camellia lanceoleosa TaxID=1840588 RepID=A0ACC0ICX8_9ERIC|nr:putative thimet oligopeptidase [Camellia lanceoleosa]